MAQLIEVWWKNIPAQVIVKKSRKQQYKYVLEARFEKVIDRMAMRGRDMDADAYLAGFRKTPPVAVEEGDLQAIANNRGKQLEAEYTNERLEQIIKSATKTVAV